MIGFGETLVAIVAIIAGCWMFASIAKHTIKWLSGEYGSEKATPSSLTTSELERLMRRAVAEATQPLEEKIERLEQRPDSKVRHLPEHMEPRDFGLLADTEHLQEGKRHA